METLLEQFEERDFLDLVSELRDIMAGCQAHIGQLLGDLPGEPEQELAGALQSALHQGADIQKVLMCVAAIRRITPPERSGVMNAVWTRPLEQAAAPVLGFTFHKPDRTVRHELLSEGGVRIILPSGGEITDAQARRLAWALLADLAPDEVVPVPDVVTFKEGQRLAVLRAVASGARTSRDIASALDWTVRQAQRRAAELAGDGRLASSRAGRGGVAIRYSLQLDKTGA